MQNSINYKSKDIFVSLLIFVVLILFSILPFEKMLNLTISFETLFIISRFKIWLGLLLLYLYVSKVQKQSFLLWSEIKYSLVQILKSVFLTLLSIVAVMFIFGIIMRLSEADMNSEKLKKIIDILKNNFALLFFVCLTAGITEEFLFRGFLLPRLELVFKNYKYAIVASSIIFGLMHFSYETFAQVIGPILIGTIFAFHYYKYRSIKIVIICHFMWDFIALLIKTKN